MSIHPDKNLLILFGLLIINLIFSINNANAQKSVPDWLDWAELPDFPAELGLGGAFIGESNGVLIVAGGSNFTTPIWDGGEKQFYRDVYILKKSLQGEIRWEKVGDLPFPVSNGASVTTTAGVLCMGGSNGDGDLDSVLMLKWDPETRELTINNNFPKLPMACSYPSAAISGERVYLAGGKNQDYPDGMKNFWALNLVPSDVESFNWEKLDAWEGPGRFGAVLGVQNNGIQDCIYLFSGKNGNNNYLTDAYQFNPAQKGKGNGWTQKSNVPQPIMAAPSVRFGQTHILVFSGSDGHDTDRINELKESYHFSKDILAYHTITDTWIKVGNLPIGLVTSNAVWWDGKLVIPGGEIGPGRRTNKVYAGIPGAVAKSIFHWVDYLTLGIYLLFITLLGVYFSREKDGGTRNYFLGSGKIPYWAAAMSIMATSISSIGFMATPSKSFATDWAYFAGTLTMFVVVPVVVFAFIPFYQRLKVVSAYEYLEARFSVLIRLFAASVYCVFQIVGRMSIVLYLPGIALSAVTGIDVYLSIMVMGVLSTLYTVLGGMKAVIWTDVVQAFILVGGALLCILVAVISLEGSAFSHFQNAYNDQKFNIGSVADWDYATASLWVVVMGNVFYRLSTYTSDQSIVQRYMVTSDLKKAQKASWTSLALLVPWSIIVFTLGSTLYIFYKANPIALNPTVNTDGILPLFIAQNMPIGLSGLIIAAIFAAAMSSLDSAMHSTSTVIVTDFYKRFFPTSTDRDQLKLAKLLIGVFGILGTGISMLMVAQNYISIWDLFIEFTGLFGGITAGLFFLGIFTTRGHANGAILGILCSAAIMIWVKSYTDIHILLYGAISLISCFVIGYLASLFIKGKSNTQGLTLFTKI